MALFTYQNTAIINKKPVKMITEDKLKFRLCKQIEIVANKTLEVSRYEHHVRPNNGIMNSETSGYHIGHSNCFLWFQSLRLRCRAPKKLVRKKRL